MRMRWMMTAQHNKYAITKVLKGMCREIEIGSDCVREG